MSSQLLANFPERKQITSINRARIKLPEPLPQQVPILESPAKRKVIRAGRRFSKSRTAMIAGIDGHGPRDATGKKLFPGVLQGGDVVWVAQDYPNLSTVMWREEFVPRFKHLPFVRMNALEHFIEFKGLGTLFLRPETAISGIRGIGKNLKGVILDEAAWYDLESAIKDVILPALLDNNGWLMLMSTTNAGWDGNADRRTPSYFNLICEEIRAKERGPDWVEFFGTAYDNPKLTKAGIDELVGEYDDGSPALRQEVFAELLRGGSGMALPKLNASEHMVEAFPVPKHWQQWGAFDWGYHHPFAFGWFAANDDGEVYLVDSLHGLDGSRHGLPDKRRLVPKLQAEEIKRFAPVAQLWPIVAGHDCWAKHQALGQETPSVAEQFAELGVNLLQAGIDRIAGLTNMRQYIEPVGVTGPRYRLMDTPGNRYTLRVLQGMQVDPKKIEDALKVDASPTTGLGGDDPYDMNRYGLGVRPYAPVKPDRWAPKNLQGDVQGMAWMEQMSDTLEPWNQPSGGVDYGYALRNDED